MIDVCCGLSLSATLFPAGVNPWAGTLLAMLVLAGCLAVSLSILVALSGVAVTHIVLRGITITLAARTLTGGGSRRVDTGTREKKNRRNGNNNTAGHDGRGGQQQQQQQRGVERCRSRAARQHTRELVETRSSGASEIRGLAHGGPCALASTRVAHGLLDTDHFGRAGPRESSRGTRNKESNGHNTAPHNFAARSFTDPTS